MSQKKLKKKGENIKLFFNHHLNIFPDDFFVTKNKKLIIYKNPYNEEDAKNEKNKNISKKQTKKEPNNNNMSKKQTKKDQINNYSNLRMKK